MNAAGFSRADSSRSFFFPDGIPQVPLSAVVFDLDGTLVHSAPDLHAAANAMLSDFDLPSVTLEAIISFVGNGVPKLVDRCLASVGAEELPAEQALAAFRKHYLAKPYELTRPYDGVVDLLLELRKNGVALGVCTNKPAHMTSVILEGLQLSSYFQAVVGGDSLPVRKPSPEPLWHSLDGLEVSVTEALYVGDSEVDAETAASAGVAFALFERGYRKTQVENMSTDFVFSDYDELGRYIREC